MQYDVKTPSDYLQALDDDWRKQTLLSLRKIIHSKSPDITECMQYKMLCYGGTESSVFHLNAQKNYVSLYVGNTKKIDPTGDMLKGLDLGKGCIRFKKSTVVSASRIDEFIEQAINLWESGEDVGC